MPPASPPVRLRTGPLSPERDGIRTILVRPVGDGGADQTSAFSDSLPPRRPLSFFSLSLFATHSIPLTPVLTKCTPPRSRAGVARSRLRCRNGASGTAGVQRWGTWVGGHEWEALGARGTRNKDGVRDRLEATTRDTTHARVHVHGGSPCPYVEERREERASKREREIEKEGERERERMRKGIQGKREMQNLSRSSGDEVVTMWWRTRRRRKKRARWNRGKEERISGDSTHGEPWRNGPARPGRQPCWLHGRQAAASRLTAAAYYTGRGRERERELGQETFREGGGEWQRGTARAREKSRGESPCGEGLESSTGP